MQRPGLRGAAEIVAQPFDLAAQPFQLAFRAGAPLRFPLGARGVDGQLLSERLLLGSRGVGDLLCPVPGVGQRLFCGLPLAHRTVQCHVGVPGSCPFRREVGAERLRLGPSLEFGGARGVALDEGSFRGDDRAMGLSLGCRGAFGLPLHPGLGNLPGGGCLLCLLPGGTQCLGRLESLPGRRGRTFDGLDPLLAGLLGDGGALPGCLLGAFASFLRGDPALLCLGDLGMCGVDRRDRRSLHLVEAGGDRRERGGEALDRSADDIQLLPEALGVEPERAAARVQAERAQRLPFRTSHLRAGPAALPAGVAAETPAAPALRAGGGQRFPALAVSATYGLISHG
jgi:hypothetical protein